MSKLLIFSDLHIACHKKSTERLKDCIQTLEWIFKTVKSEEVKYIICVGDLFHDRQRIDVLTYQNAFQIFQKYLQKELNPVPQVYLLLGNHDMWHNEKWDISSVFPLNAIESVSVIDKPCIQEIEGRQISFLPYTKNPIEDLKLINSQCGERDILFAHVAIDGALWNVKFNTIADVSIEHDGDMIKVGPDIFQGWSQVFMGHYHAAQKLADNIEYVGSPLQLDFGETEQEKHIIVLDLETNEKKYIKNTFSPRHFYYYPEQDGEINNWIKNKKIRKGDFVTIRTTSINNPENIDYQHTISESTGEPVKVKPKKKSILEDRQVIKDAKSILFDEEKMAKMYIESVNINDLKESQLMTIFGDIRKKKENS